MLDSLYTGANAISTYENALSTTANNIANINTPYFKSNSIQLAELKHGGVAVSSIRQNQELSYTIQSGRTLDFVIDGEGMFRLDDNGQDYFTRRGDFTLDAEGNITDREGRILLPEVIDEGESISDADIAEDGTITVNGEFRGKVDVYSQYGEEIAENHYRLRTGELEASNVDLAREMVNMMITQNAMTANYANVRAGDEMLGMIVDMVS